MQIPLFPLHTVLSPGIALPLHIFEDRYRAMIRRCVDTSTPFGVVLIRDGREVGAGGQLAIAGVGTFAEIRQAEERSDGRWEILVVGGGRFTVEEVHVDREPYLVGEVVPLPEQVGDDRAAARLVRRVTRRFVEYLRLMRARDGEDATDIDVQLEIEVGEGDEEASGGATAGNAAAELGEDDEAARIVRRLIIPDDPTVLGHLLVGIVQVELVRKQALLEADTTVERLRALDALLDRELTLLRYRLRPYTIDPRHLEGRLS
jgi:uncharacterized protein